MPIVVLDPLEDAQWDRRLAGLAQAGVFHSRAWAEALALAYGFVRRYVVLEEGGALRALLPVMEVRRFGGAPRAVALPFSDFVPLAAHDPQAGDDVLAHVLRQGAQWGWKTLELRGGEVPRAPAVARFLRHEIDLQVDQKQLFARLKPSARTAIRKANAQGVTIARGTDDAYLAAFQRLNAITRRRHGLPPQPSRFFRAIHEVLLQRGLGEIWIARHDGQDVAAALFLVHGDQATFKYGCSDYRRQRLRANNLLMWRAMQDLAQRGMTRLCLGRTALAHEGLRRFKLGLGAREEAVSYCLYDYRRVAYVAGGSSMHAWYGHVFKALPLWLNRRLGDMFYHLAA